MKSSKKGSVLPIVVVGLMMVSVIAFIFLSAALYGNTAYEASSDELDEKLMLDEIGSRFLRIDSDDDYQTVLDALTWGEHVGAVPSDGEYIPKSYNIVVSYDKMTLIVKDESMTETLFTIVAGEKANGERYAKVWVYGAYRGDGF